MFTKSLCVLCCLSGKQNKIREKSENLEETMPCTEKLPVSTGGSAISSVQFTTLLAQLLLANASGLALNAKPIPRI